MVKQECSKKGAYECVLIAAEHIRRHGQKDRHSQNIRSMKTQDEIVEYVNNARLWEIPKPGKK